jgi:hypothetical protein
MTLRYALSLGVGLFTMLARAATPTATLLFDDESLAGWRFVTPGTEGVKQICKLSPEGVLKVSGKPNGYLETLRSFENYRLHVEWRWIDKPGNGGILLHITEGPMDRIWPVCFQVQTKNTRAGDVLPMSAAQFAESPTPKMTPAQLARSSADSEKAVGEWNTCEIVCQADTIEVTINGVLQNRVTKCVPASGKIGFQLEGTPFELRNVRITPVTVSQLK